MAIVKRINIIIIHYNILNKIPKNLLKKQTENEFLTMYSF